MSVHVLQVARPISMFLGFCVCTCASSCQAGEKGGKGRRFLKVFFGCFWMFFGGVWLLWDVFGCCWKVLEVVESFWMLLEVLHYFWMSLDIFDLCCFQMFLTVFHIC